VDADVSAGNPARRQVIDEQGNLWDVRETVRGTTTTYDRRSGGVLVFESSAVIRMVRKFPPDWASKSDAELLEISEGL
jgi:hypothetical protein